VSNEPGNDRRQSLHGQWSTRLAFILAVTGSAVGLGNIWRFPYVAGESGGGAFVLIYLACILLIGLPVIMSEILLGRRGRRNPVATMALLAEEEGSSRHWGLVGGMGVLAGFLILSFYSVIAGWSLAYVVESATGAFADAGAGTLDAVFSGLTGSATRLGFWHTLFMILTVFVVARGVQKGLERAVRILVPALLVLMLVLLGYSITSGGFGDGLTYLFAPDFSRVTAGVILTAIGQAFFTLSLGMGAIMAYGAYLPEDASIGGTAIAVVVADTSIALLAGLVIFPIVFANGLDPDQGPGLIFRTLPLAFGEMPYGQLFATLFFVLLSFAAWTSAISMIEPAVAWLMERFDIIRAGAAILIGTLVWLFGFLSVFSFNLLSDFTFVTGTMFDNLDNLTNNLMLPLGGLFVVIFASWVMSTDSSAAELDLASPLRYQIWQVLARYVAPLALIAAFLHAIGAFGLFT